MAGRQLVCVPGRTCPRQDAGVCPRQDAGVCPRQDARQDVPGRMSRSSCSGHIRRWTRAELGLQYRLCHVDEFAHHRPRVARIHDLLDVESLRCAER